MRGTIIMWTGEKGAVAASGQQFKFEIEHWRGEVAPKPDMAVEVTLADGALVSLTPVEASEVARERLTQLSGQGSKFAQNVYGNVGKSTAIAYAIFGVAALFASFVSIKGAFGLAAGGVTLATVLGGLGSSGDAMGVFLILLALASIAVPFLWKDKFAPLAFCLPMLITLYGDSKLYNAYHQVTAIFGNQSNPFAEMIRIRLGLGAYVTFIAGAYIAIRGIRQYVQNLKPIDAVVADKI